MLFPKALFLATTFPKLAKNLIFLLNFYHKFSKFSQNFPTICVFRPNARKGNAWFVKFIWKYSQLMHFKQFSKEFFWEFSKISQIFRTIYVFRPNARKVSTLFVKDFRETCQDNRFVAIFLRNFLKIFSKFPDNLFFRPNARKINSDFLKICSK